MATKLAEKHGVDLTSEEAQLRLDMKGFDRLIIKRVSKNLVSVGHYFEQGDNLIGDPEIIFFTGYDEWVPIEISQALGGYRIYATLSPGGESLAFVDLLNQASLALFTKDWAENIKAQGWLENSIKWEPRNQDRSPMPDLDTLIAWADEGVCEATDGCIVETDGVCPHGCNSWLLELGLI